MAGGKVVYAVLVIVVFAHGATIAKPKPATPYLGPGGAAAGGPGLGVVVPNMMGWGGWSTPPPETTTTPETTPTPGWSVETTVTPGWTDDNSGWIAQPPPPPTGWSAESPVEISMLGEALVLGAGEAGATHGSEITVIGDGYTPAVASFSSGSYSSLGQGTGILQISNIGADGESNTFHGIDSYNFGDAGEYLGGNAVGTQVDVTGGGGSYIVGEGAIEQDGWTQNSGKKNEK